MRKRQARAEQGAMQKCTSLRKRGGGAKKGAEAEGNATIRDGNTRLASEQVCRGENRHQRTGKRNSRRRGDGG